MPQKAERDWAEAGGTVTGGCSPSEPLCNVEYYCERMVDSLSSLHFLPLLKSRVRESLIYTSDSESEPTRQNYLLHYDVQHQFHLNFWESLGVFTELHKSGSCACIKQMKMS